jgi:hypothetical protein
VEWKRWKRIRQTTSTNWKRNPPGAGDIPERRAGRRIAADNLGAMKQHRKATIIAVEIDRAKQDVF